MPSEWHCVMVAEAAVFTLAGFGLSVADGWPVVPTAALAVVGLSVCVMLPGLLLDTAVPVRAAQTTALAMLAVVAASVLVDYIRDDKNVTMFLFAPRWEQSTWQAAARARALLIVLPACAVGAACVRAAYLEAKRGAQAVLWPRVGHAFGVAQVLVAVVQLTLAENESRDSGVSSDQLIESFTAIRDWSLIFLFAFMLLELVALAVAALAAGLPTQIVATVMSVLNFAFCVTAPFTLWPQDYVWVNFSLAMLQLCAVAWDLVRVWRADGEPEAALEAAPAAEASQPLSEQESSFRGPAPINGLAAPFRARLQPLYKDSLERGIQQATRFARQHTPAARIQKVKNL